MEITELFNDKFTFGENAFVHQSGNDVTVFQIEIIEGTENVCWNNTGEAIPKLIKHTP